MSSCQNTQPLVSFVIPTHNGGEDVIECLDSVVSQTYNNIEILVVDDNSDDDTPEQIKYRFPNIDIITLSENRGHAGASNVGFRASNGYYLALLDDDSTIPPNWTVKLVNKFEELDNEVAVVHPKIIEPIGSKFEEEGEITTFQGCGVLARKNALESVGYYDERYFVYGDDRELAARLLTNGYTIYGYPEVATNHKGAWPLSKKKGEFQTYYYTRNQFWYIWKYYPLSGVITQSITRLILSGILAVRDGTVRSYIEGVVDAYKKFGTFAIKERQPYSKIDYVYSFRDLVRGAGRNVHQKIRNLNPLS